MSKKRIISILLLLVLAAGIGLVLSMWGGVRA